MHTDNAQDKSLQMEYALAASAQRVDGLQGWLKQNVALQAGLGPNLYVGASVSVGMPAAQAGTAMMQGTAQGATSGGGAIIGSSHAV